MKALFRMSLVLCLVLAVLLSGLPAVAGETEEKTFGLDSGSNPGSLSANVLHAMRFENTAGTGALNKLEVLFDSRPRPAGSVMMGIYDDDNGSPGRQLIDAGEINVNANGWIAIDSLELEVQEGDYYWLAFNLSASNRVPFQRNSGAHVWASVSYSSGLPADFPTPAGSDSNQYVMRAWVNYYE